MQRKTLGHPATYILTGTCQGIDVFEEFLSRESAHERWDELMQTNPREINLKIKEVVPTRSHKRKTLTLAQKIFRIRRECPTIERKGVAYSFNPEDKPAYAYAQVEDVLTPINKLLDKYKLLLTGEAAKEPMTHVSKTQSTTEVMMVWTLEDIETTEARSYRIPGSGSDNQGKGVFKSMTGSRKYACILIFNLILGDEPEENARAASSKEESTRNVDAGVSG